MLERLNEIILDLKARLDRQPTFGWAVVTSVSPLMIRYDAQDEPIAGTPDRLVSGLAVGDRVWVQRQHRRDIVLGRGGEVGPRSGVVSKSTGALANIGGTNVWGAAMELRVPVALAPDEYIVLTPVNIGNGWGSFSQTGITHGLDSTTVLGRFTQVNNSGSQTPVFVWQVVRSTG